LVIVAFLLSVGLASKATGAEHLPASAVCRVHNQLSHNQLSHNQLSHNQLGHNQLGSFGNVGSGTLVDVTSDGSQGLVLTCAHLFREGVGQLVVEFPGGKRHGARLVAIDHQADLAALAIANPTSEPVRVNLLPTNGEPLRACGYGSQGNYRCMTGNIIGEAVAEGQHSLQIAGAVRSGDSGGGVFDGEGNLVAVTWGERDGVTYASHGAPLKRFLDRVLGKRMSVVCHNGVCRPGPSSVPQQRPTLSPPPRDNALPQLAARISELDQRIDHLEQTKQDSGNFVTSSELAQFASSAELARLESQVNLRFESLAVPCESPSTENDSLGFGTWAVEPLAWVVLAALVGGSWLAGRKLKWNGRGAGGRRREPFRRAQTARDEEGGIRDGGA